MKIQHGDLGQKWLNTQLSPEKLHTRIQRMCYPSFSFTCQNPVFFSSNYNSIWGGRIRMSSNPWLLRWEQGRQNAAVTFESRLWKHHSLVSTADFHWVEAEHINIFENNSRISLLELSSFCFPVAIFYDVDLWWMLLSPRSVQWGSKNWQTEVK